MHPDFDRAAEALIACYRNGNKILLCGNGGSSADCAHILGELVKGFCKKRPLKSEIIDAIGEEWANSLQQGLPAIDLTANAALISAVINDIDGASVYAQQVTAYGKPGDILIAISTSGNAENVRRAALTAKAMGMTVIGMTGRSGGKLAAISDILLNVDEDETYRIQEKHLPLYHQLCLRVENAFFEK